MESTNTLFPVFLKTETAHFLIVGGGNVGLEKTETLLKQNPQVSITIVATYFHVNLKEIIQQNSNVTAIERAFDEADLIGKDYVIITTDKPEVNLEVRELARYKGIKVNAADQPALCDFYLGSIVNKGSLKIAISTNGKSPVLAKRMREYFTEVIPDTIENNLESLNQLRSNHKGNFQEKLADLNKITSVINGSKTKKTERNVKKLVLDITILFMVFFIGFGLSKFISYDDILIHAKNIPNAFYGMLLVGFFAQLVDGAVGLGYGVTCATSMMLLGINLPAISGSIHTAEMFSSGISGYSHYKFGNVNKKLFYWLAIPGVLGAISGASLLIYLGNKYQTITYALLSIYTMSIGIRLIIIAYRKVNKKQKVNHTGSLGFAGGFFDAFAGGGWGPIVTSTLLAKGRKSSYVVGTVSLAEFFVTLAAAITFFSSLGISHWYIILGLILGGSIAAPFAAKLAGKLPQKKALLCVAFLVIVFSLRILVKII
ncbi:TSUP family transporter [Flavobacterium paronense]|uniref:Probable membrane transporter protein n=1 Tax=Flavobacterium paronense TaxID=1392775 RepID=A0ABV5GH54_9FLAO|nr:TSUP family transporter [Flavobacterium paronense]MDN3676382.1 TSUP family transporter [Flavobacterium paronense]